MAWNTIASLEGLGDTTAASLARTPSSAFRSALADVFGGIVAGEVVAGGTVTVTEGSTWAAGVTVTNGIARFNFTVPPGGAAWAKTGTALTTTADVATLTAGIYRVGNGTTATALNLPIKDASALTIVAMSSSPTNHSATVEQWGFDGKGGVTTSRAWRDAAGVIGPWSKTVQSRLLADNEDGSRVGDGTYGVLASRTVQSMPAGVSGVLSEATVGDTTWSQMLQSWTVSGGVDLLARSMSTTARQTWQRPESPRAVEWARRELATMRAELTGARADGSVPASAYTATAASIPMTVPTPDGTGQATHPSVVDVPAGWNGHRYWMAYTPYAFANDALEDPCVAWSDNGTAWTAATGAFPLDDAPGGADFNSDTNAVLHNGTMYVFWRRSDANGTKVWVRSSTDGSTWSAKTVAWDPAGMSAFSPSIVKTATGWRLWFVGGAAGTRKLKYVDTTAAVPTSGWGAAVDAVTPLPPGREPWHVEVHLLGGRWWGLLTDTTSGQNGVACDVRLMQSDDGITWDVSSTQLIPRLGHSHDVLYKSSATFTGTALKPTISLWYSGLSADKGWWLYRGGAVTLHEPRKSTMTELTTQSLDDLPLGTYFQVNNANATVARGYPVEGRSGTLLVLPSHPTIGRFTEMFIANHKVGAGIHVRTKDGTGWSAWSEYLTRTAANALYGSLADMTRVSGQFGTKSVSIDTDGTPYYDTATGTHFILQGPDGTPHYRQTIASTLTVDANGVPELA